MWCLGHLSEPFGVFRCLWGILFEYIDVFWLYLVLICWVFWWYSGVFERYYGLCVSLWAIFGHLRVCGGRAFVPFLNVYLLSQRLSL